jgi:pyruvate dehydrogenase E2 component (dihydrolipoamide acetyltransferase)
MGNLSLVKKRDLSSFRKIALGTWHTAYDPSIYGTLTLRMDRALDYIERFRARTGRRLTVSHLMAKASAMALHECPDANAILRWNRIYLRQRIGIFFQVLMTDQGEGKADLSGATLYDLERKSLLEIVDEFETKVGLVRERKDPALEKTRGTFQRIPFLMLKPFLQLLSFLSFTLNLDLRALGIASDPFGSMMITNVGSLGLDTAFAPLVPFSRVPILFALGEAKEQVLAVDGRVTVGMAMSVNATLDHRVIDGFHASRLAAVLREWMENPDAHFDATGEVALQSGGGSEVRSPASARATPASLPRAP